MVTTKRSLTLYLQGHYAGSEAAVRTVRQQVAIEPDSEVGRVLAHLAEEIDADQAQLREVMGRFGVTPSAPKNLLGRVGSQVGRWALRANAPGDPQARLIGLESLSLGIEGKASLWRALREVAAVDPRIADVGIDDLLKRAELQREQLEPHRLEAARRAGA